MEETGTNRGHDGVKTGKQASSTSSLFLSNWTYPAGPPAVRSTSRRCQSLVSPQGRLVSSLRWWTQESTVNEKTSSSTKTSGQHLGVIVGFFLFGDVTFQGQQPHSPFQTPHLDGIVVPSVFPWRHPLSVPRLRRYLRTVIIPAHRHALTQASVRRPSICSRADEEDLSTG